MKLYYPDKIFPAFCLTVAFFLARAFDPGALNFVLYAWLTLWSEDLR
jgi:hypothetical protein